MHCDKRLEHMRSVEVTIILFTLKFASTIAEGLGGLKLNSRLEAVVDANPLYHNHVWNSERISCVTAIV